MIKGILFIIAAVISTHPAGNEGTEKVLGYSVIIQ